MYLGEFKNIKKDYAKKLNHMDKSIEIPKLKTSVNIDVYYVPGMRKIHMSLVKDMLDYPKHVNKLIIYICEHLEYNRNYLLLDPKTIQFELGITKNRYSAALKFIKEKDLIRNIDPTNKKYKNVYVINHTKMFYGDFNYLNKEYDKIDKEEKYIKNKIEI